MEARRRRDPHLPGSHRRHPDRARYGLPYIGAGQRVRVETVRCERRIVARRIARAGRIVAPTTAECWLGSHWRGDPGLVHDRTTLFAVAVVALGLADVIAVRTRRRGSRPAHPG